MNFEKYRIHTEDYIQLVCIEALVCIMDDEEGLKELYFKDDSVYSSKILYVPVDKMSTFNFIEWINHSLSVNMFLDDIEIVGDTISIWSRENEDGEKDEEGSFTLNYKFILKINNKIVKENDLIKIFERK